MSTPQPPAKTSEHPPQPEGITRPGGLTSLGRGHMPPVFTALLTVGFLDILFLLLLPTFLHRGTDSAWVLPHRISFMGVSVLTGLAFGLLASVTADRRGYSAWWLIAGHMGTFLAPVLAVAGVPESHPTLAQATVAGVCAAGAFGCFFLVREPRDAMAHGPLTRRLSRIFNNAGNIWLGISLLSAFIVMLTYGTIVEDRYGHKAAHGLVYQSPVFQLLFATFAISLISATLRKYPWRVDQAGWLAVHAALLVVIVGTFMTFMGKKEGMLALKEGESASQFQLATETRIQVLRATSRGLPMGRDPVWQGVATFDLDPTNLSPHHVYAAELGSDTLPITVEKYYADAERDLQITDDGDHPRAAVHGHFIPPGSPREQEFYVVENEGRGPMPGMLPMEFHHTWSKDSRQTLLSGGQNDQPARLVVLDADGRKLLSLPFQVPTAARSGGSPAPLDTSAKVPGTEVTVKVTDWYDQYRRIGQRDVDASPGYPKNPAVQVAFSGPRGDAQRFALSWAQEGMAKMLATDVYKDFQLRLEYWVAPRNALWFVPGEGTSVDWVYRSRSGEQRTGRVTPGVALDLGIPLQIIPEKTFTHLKVTESYTLDGYQEERPVIRLGFPEGVETGREESWLHLGDTQGLPFRFKGQVWILRWMKSSWELGFNLHLFEFHRDFYEGSRAPKTFESYLRLTDPHSNDPRLQPSANIKIDMNHPLRYRGWRLYQHRFAEGPSEMTILQVNRDPGLPVTYLGCSLLTLGLVIVFFQKNFLRAWGRFLRRRSAGQATLVLASVAVVLLAFLSCVPGLVMISMMSEGPLLVFGVLAIVVVLALETVMLNTVGVRTLERTPRTQPAPKLPAGALS